MKTATGAEKPLAEWTLKELHEYCNNSTISACDTCEFRRMCRIDPHFWDLEEKPKFTAQEIEDAKTLNRILSGKLYRIGRDENGSVSVSYTFLGNFVSCIKLNKYSFPSIGCGNQYDFAEITGGSDA